MNSEQIIQTSPKHINLDEKNKDSGFDLASNKVSLAIIESNKDLMKNSVSSLRSLKVSPEIFIRIKIQNIYEQYTKGQILGNGTYGQVCLVTHKKTG